MPTSNCVKCGAPLRRLAAGGRPAKFCSIACRRAAEYELRRIQTGLERIEERQEHIRIYGAESAFCFPLDPAEALARLQGERSRYEVRLRELFVDDADP